MHSIPERQNKDDRRNRFDQYGHDHLYTALPDVSGFEYLTELFLDSGICSHGSMGGYLPLTWLELKSFNDCGKLELSGWELSRLMDMSREYCNWQNKGSKQKDMADNVPFIDESRSAKSYIDRQREAIKKNQEI